MAWTSHCESCGPKSISLIFCFLSSCKAETNTSDKVLISFLLIKNLNLFLICKLGIPWINCVANKWLPMSVGLILYACPTSLVNSEIYSCIVIALWVNVESFDWATTRLPNSENLSWIFPSIISYGSFLPMSSNVFVQGARGGCYSHIKGSFTSYLL